MQVVDEYVERMRAVIAEHRLAVQVVGPSIEKRMAPFGYTVGLTAWGAPELCVAGFLPPTLMGDILNTVALRAFDGERFAHGQELDGVIAEGFTVKMVDGDANEDSIWPGMAYRLYRPELVRLQQIVWPDSEGRFPWDPVFEIPPDHQPLICPV